MNEEYARIIETMGFDPEDNAALTLWLDEAIQNAQIADRDEGLAWVLGEGWPWPDSPITAADQDALRAYLAMAPDHHAEEYAEMDWRERNHEEEPS